MQYVSPRLSKHHGVSRQLCVWLRGGGVMSKCVIQDRELEVAVWNMSEDKSVSGKREQESVGQNEKLKEWESEQIGKREWEADPMCSWGHIVCMVRPTERLRTGDVWSLLKEFCGIVWLVGCVDTRISKEFEEEGKCWPASLRTRMWGLFFLWLHLLSSGFKTFPEVAILMASSPKHHARKYLSACYRQGPGPWANQISEKNMGQSTVGAPGCQGNFTSSIQPYLTEHLPWSSLVTNEYMSLLREIFDELAISL